jgi:hypothetical protein
LAKLAAVGVKPPGVGSGAELRVEAMGHSGVFGLMQNGGGEVDFVVRRADAGTEIEAQSLWRDLPFSLHGFDGGGNDAQGGSFFSRVEQSNGGAAAVKKINRRTVGDKKAQQKVGSVG